MNLSIYYTCKNIQKACNSNSFETSAAPWNDESEIPDGSYFVALIQYYSQCVIKHRETLITNPPIRIYVKRIESWVSFKIQTGRTLELHTQEKDESTEKSVTIDKNGEVINKQVINKQELKSFIYFCTRQMILTTS